MEVWNSASGLVIPLFKNRDQGVCSSHREVTLVSLPGKVYTRVLESTVWQIPEPHITYMLFLSWSWNTGPALDLARILKGAWEFAKPVRISFVVLEKAFDCVPCGVLWGILWIYGVLDPYLHAIQPM